jgi:thiol-disulfide isomerase/thioredoxin
MSRLIAGAVLLALFLSPLRADDKAAEKPGRAERLKKIQDEFQKARNDLGKAIRDGTVKPNADGDYPEWMEVQKRFARPLRELIDADPADAVSLDAVLFFLSSVGAEGAAEARLYQLVVEHHLTSEKIDPLIRQRSAPADFLRAVVAKSPHAKLRLWANYHLADNLYQAGKPKEAEALLEALAREPVAKDEGGYGSGTLADTAGRLLFEIHRLSVGQEVPEVVGKDLDGKPMKLSESRGKVTLLVFWATWCGPCMAMVPHERALVERYAGKPFVLVGANGDILPEPNFNVTGPDGKAIDNTERVKAVIEKQKITWRSFRNAHFNVGTEWNVRAWPTVYLIDHRGIIRGKWKGDPGEKELDDAVGKLVKLAEAERNDPGK